MSKMAQNDKLKVRFLDKIYSTNLISLMGSYIDLNMPNAINFFIGLAQINPTKFFDYLK